MPQVTFIIPSYNYASHIAAALESVLSVAQGQDEIIVVDDGSTDDTRAVIEPYAEKSAIRYHFQENAGVSAARNTGARLAANDYLYFLDADDRIIMEGFRRLREVAESQPRYAMIFGGHVSVDGKRRRSHPQKPVTDNQTRNFIDYVIGRRFSIANGGAVLVKREVALKYPYPEGLRVSEDFCVYAWILANEPVLAIADEVVEISKHPDSLRNQVVGYSEVIESLPDIVFDTSRLPHELMRYRQRFYCNRLLSLFRALYLAGHNKQAKKTYIKAIRCRWLNIFKLSYLRKYLRCVLR
ncbi:MAG: glycosyltransferase family 2 protein [Gammaproteobacteria bacterium]|nr:glycosyltransferase family 2 protein [Gammaproteobacteria bacterium]